MPGSAISVLLLTVFAYGDGSTRALGFRRFSDVRDRLFSGCYCCIAVTQCLREFESTFDIAAFSGFHSVKSFFFHELAAIWRGYDLLSSA